MRYMYALMVMTGIGFMTAGSARGDDKEPKPPSKSCPKDHNWDNSKGACMPPPCKTGYTWDKSKNKCEPNHH